MYDLFTTYFLLPVAWLTINGIHLTVTHPIETLAVIMSGIVTTCAIAICRS